MQSETSGLRLRASFNSYTSTCLQVLVGLIEVAGTPCTEFRVVRRSDREWPAISYVGRRYGYITYSNSRADPEGGKYYKRSFDSSRTAFRSIQWPYLK